MEIKVGYLGPDETTFGYMAMQKYFTGRNIEIKPEGFDSHSVVCEKVGRKNVKLGVVAIENVLDGIVPETARAVEKVDSHLGLKIQGEVVLSIKLHFASKTGNPADVKKIISHRSALGQCHLFIVERMNEGIDYKEKNSTGAAAEEASCDESSAVLAPMNAIEKYGLKIIKEDVTDHQNSATRFWILGKEHADKTGNDRTCFLVNLEQPKPGGLYQTLGVFAKRGVNVLLVYPISIFGKQWEYTFLIEVKGHIDDDDVDKAWDDFNKLGISLRSMQFLGSYPNSIRT